MSLVDDPNVDTKNSFTLLHHCIMPLPMYFFLSSFPGATTLPKRTSFHWLVQYALLPMLIVHMSTEPLRLSGIAQQGRWTICKHPSTVCT